MKWLLCWAVFVPPRCDGAFSRPVMCLLLLIHAAVRPRVGGGGRCGLALAYALTVGLSSDYVPTDVPIRADVTN